MLKNPYNSQQSLGFWKKRKFPESAGTVFEECCKRRRCGRNKMKKKIIEKLKSLNKRLAGDWFRGIGVAHRLRSFYEQMKWSLKNHEAASLAEPIPLEGNKRSKQVIAGYLTGKILVDQGVIKSEQLAEALKRQRELQERGKRKGLGVLLVEMGYTTSKEYLDALSRYFGLPIKSLLKFIPSPAVQGLLADRYAHYNRLLILADYGTEVTLALAEPDPLILEELKKTLKNKEKVNFYLANPFEMERCYRLYLDPFSMNFYR
jgi:hypothetical protein